MVETFVMLCILYATSVAHPPVSNVVQGLPAEIPPAYIQQSEDKPQSKDAADANLDYAEELKKLGYCKVISDDKDLVIRNEVIHFQSDLNLEVTGVWDENCLSALRKRIKDVSFSFTDKITAPPTNDKWIVINKASRIITLYTGKNVLKKYPVAVGNPPSLTPSGKYEIANKIIDPAWGGGGYAQPVSGGSPDNPLGHRWMGLSINGGDRYGVHGNTAPYSIGTDASHGCIRMVNQDVEELFDLVAISTPVWIGKSEELVEWGVSQNSYFAGK